MATTDYKFEGWMGLDPKSADGKMKWQVFQPKCWDEKDIEIKITHSGICGSDIHTLRSGWAPTMYPCCVGHEIIGIAMRVGARAENGIKVGDRVGVGAQSDCCRERKGACEECSSGLEHHCPINYTGTYNGLYLNGDKSYGGYALYHRAPSYFVFKIPDAIPSAHAAPMLCAGITTYSPLKNSGCGPGKRVGVIGVGGLGHFGLKWARALGASKVVGISRKVGKRVDVMNLGADDYIATDEELGWDDKYARTLDIILCTVSNAKMPLTGYFKLLRTQGTFIQVGLPEGGMPSFNHMPLVQRNASLQFSFIGSPSQIKEMLQLAAERKVSPWVVERPMKEANQAILDAEAGKPRYRYVLVNDV